MNKIEFKNELKLKLEDNEIENIQEILDYYDEIISDRIEAGENECEIVQSLSNFSDIINANKDNVALKSEQKLKEEVFPLTNKLEINLRNSKIFIEKSPDEYVHICYHDYKLKSYTLTQSADNTVFTDKKKGFWRAIASVFLMFEIFHNDPVRVYIPENKICSFVARSSNGRITANGISANSVMLKSSNGRVVINCLSIENQIIIDSSNGRIICNNVDAYNIDASTSNGRIVGSNIVAEKAKFFSSNGRIDLNDFDIKDADMYTSNGRLILGVKGRIEDINLDVSTSCGAIYINGEKQGNHLTNFSGEKRLKARTSNGRVMLSFDDNRHPIRIDGASK